MSSIIRILAGVGLIAVAPLNATRAQPVDQAAHGPADSASMAHGGENQHEHVRSTMDRVFGAGRWRLTSGYRTPAQEDALRRAGAGTVPPGRLSHHSLGSPEAPGAYDIVVPGMSPRSAAAKLRNADQAFSRVFAEEAHGPQGPHLHVEPGLTLGGPSPPAADDDAIYSRIVAGRRNPLLERTRAGRSR